MHCATLPTTTVLAIKEAMQHQLYSHVNDTVLRYVSAT
jgi:hypothetical protein